MAKYQVAKSTERAATVVHLIRVTFDRDGKGGTYNGEEFNGPDRLGRYSIRGRYVARDIAQDIQQAKRKLVKPAAPQHRSARAYG